MNAFLYILILNFTFFSSHAHSQSMEISCDAPKLIYNNHVGNEWNFIYGVNDEMNSMVKTIYIPLTGGITNVKCIVQELDKYIDEARTSLEIDPTKLEYGKTYSKLLEFIVVEKNGRYSGNSAKWVVTFRFRKVNERA